MTGDIANWNPSGVTAGQNVSGWEIQSFFLESDGDAFWVMQVHDGKPEEYAGDLAITGYSRHDGVLTQAGDPMFMQGFGHGEAFGITVAEEGGRTIWSECSADGAGRGLSIAHYGWFPGTSITPSDITPLNIVGGGETVSDLSCSIQGDYLLVRFKLDDGSDVPPHYFQAFFYEDVLSGIYDEPVLSGIGRLQPTLTDPDPVEGAPSDIIQGWTFLNQYLYIIGEYPKGSPTTNPVIWSVDLNADNTVGYHARSGHKNTPGEPEGIFISATGDDIVFGTLGDNDFDANLLYNVP